MTMDFTTGGCCAACSQPNGKAVIDTQRRSLKRCNEIHLQEGACRSRPKNASMVCRAHGSPPSAFYSPIVTTRRSSRPTRQRVSQPPRDRATTPAHTPRSWLKLYRASSENHQWSNFRKLPGLQICLHVYPSPIAEPTPIEPKHAANRETAKLDRHLAAYGALLDRHRESFS